MKLKSLLLVAGAAGAVAAVIKRRGGGADIQQAPSYEPPAEALAQRPTDSGGTPSAEVPVAETAPADQLNVPEHGAPGGSVMPDTSDEDPLVRRQEKAAEGDAGAIGGDAGEAELDPAMRPVVEGSGDENEETFEAREGTERGNREAET